MPFQDRRRSPRVPLPARASLRQGEQALGDFDVVDLSAGGALLAGPAPVAVGTAVTLILALAPGEGEPVTLAGRVLRERPAQPGAAPGYVVAFTDPPAAEAARIRDRIAAVQARTHEAHVLVVDGSPLAGFALQTQLGEMGHTALVVTTPLGAVHALGLPNRIVVALVALPEVDVGRADGLDLMAHLADQHPYIRRVLLTAHAPAAALRARFRQRPQAAPHDVLARPCDHATLARAVAG
jgi:CheY-like chemotaxis protein